MVLDNRSKDVSQNRKKRSSEIEPPIEKKTVIFFARGGAEEQFRVKTLELS